MKEEKSRTPEQAQRDLENTFRRMVENEVPYTSFPIMWVFLQPNYTHAEREALKDFQKETWIKKGVGLSLSLNAMYFVCAKILKNRAGILRPLGICAASVALGYLSTHVDVQNKVVEMFPDGLAAWQVMNSRGMINKRTGLPYTDEDVQKMIFGRSFENEKDPGKAIAMFISGVDAPPAGKVKRKEPQNSGEITDIKEIHNY
ncbi:hypothetical protein FSP39_008368 [Pinctada imbricata]|uniref:Uncharacterized protein n=1 Tax=Pinctada imbricata TaxID=66713 RepID=A0AA89BX44_PINIB|nr:hypothetical protein FSP39_008368 [Pinctada imbricata]